MPEDDKKETPFSAIWRLSRAIKYRGSQDAIEAIPSEVPEKAAEQAKEADKKEWYVLPKPKRTRLIRFNPDTGTTTETVIEDEDEDDVPDTR